MAKKVIGDCVLYNASMEKTIGKIKFDHIFSDPPYLYLKHKLDKKFDEKRFFEGAKEMLPDNGFIALFGRGTSFYRWNAMLADLGFVFKEEIVWNKIMASSPVSIITRAHETISIHTKKNGMIKKVNVSYIEHKAHDIDSIVNDIKRIKSAINNSAGLDKIIDFLKTGKSACATGVKGHYTTCRSGISSGDRGSATLKCVKDGLREKSIITVPPVHYGSLHPTQKPVRLAERIIALISEPGDTIYDPFMGSGSLGVACVNMGRKYIGSEILPEYFEIAVKRIKEARKQPALGEAFNA